MLTYIRKDGTIFTYRDAGGVRCLMTIRIPELDEFSQVQCKVKAIVHVRKDTVVGLKEAYDAIQGRTDVTVRDIVTTDMHEF